MIEASRSNDLLRNHYLPTPGTDSSLQVVSGLMDLVKGGKSNYTSQKYMVVCFTAIPR